MGVEPSAADFISPGARHEALPKARQEGTHEEYRPPQLGCPVAVALAA